MSCKGCRQERCLEEVHVAKLSFGARKWKLWYVCLSIFVSACPVVSLCCGSLQISILHWVLHKWLVPTLSRPLCLLVTLDGICLSSSQTKINHHRHADTIRCDCQRSGKEEDQNARSSNRLIDLFRRPNCHTLSLPSLCFTESQRKRCGHWTTLCWSPPLVACPPGVWPRNPRHHGALGCWPQWRDEGGGVGDNVTALRSPIRPWRTPRSARSPRPWWTLVNALRRRHLTEWRPCTGCSLLGVSLPTQPRPFISFRFLSSDIRVDYIRDKLNYG